MGSTSIRNPLVGFLLVILASLALTAVAGFAGTFIPYVEFRLFFLGFAFFGAGAVAGRKTFVGSLAFVGAYLGAFFGFLLIEQLVWVNPWMEVLALGLAVPAGLGGFMMGKIGVHRLAREQRVTPGLRRCSRCGARVGLSARKCWSCKAVLTY
jgi:hypothetical protein